MKSSSLLFVYLMAFSTTFGCFNANSSKENNSDRINEEMMTHETKDPFVGQFRGQLFGMDCTLIINKISENKYAVFVNGLGPDEAFLVNGKLSGNSDGIPFSLRISNEKLVLTMFEQDLLFERESKEVIQSSSENQSHQQNEWSGNTANQDPFVGNYDLMNKDKFIMEISIRNSSGNQYIGNSPKNEFYLIKRNSIELIGEGCSIRISGSNLLYIENGQEFPLINKRPFKIIPEDGFKIDDRLLGNWKGTLSSYYGGHSSVTEYFINFRNDGSYIEVKDFASGGYSGSASLLDDDKKGYYEIIEQTKEGGKIHIYGKELVYYFLNENQKLFLYGVTYYKQ